MLAVGLLTETLTRSPEPSLGQVLVVVSLMGVSWLLFSVVDSEAVDAHHCRERGRGGGEGDTFVEGAQSLRQDSRGCGQS